MNSRPPSAESANLDLVRAVAVLCVFFAHLTDRIRGGQSDGTWLIGQMGVLIFFVHTSLVLMRSLERSPLTGPALFRDFYLRRAFRIYPLAIVVVTIAAIHGGWPLLDYLSHAALTLNLTYIEARCCALWSLPIEVQMYVFLPFLFLGLRAATTTQIALCWVGAVALALIQPSISGRLTVFSWAPCFVAGAIAWWLARRSNYRLPAWCFPLAFIAVWSIWLIATRDQHWYYRWAFTLAVGLMLPWFADLTWRGITVPALFIAKYSYGIYLSHGMTQTWALGLPLPPIAQGLALLAAGIAVPILLFHGIEAPMMQVGKHATTWRPLQTPSPAAG